MSIDDPEIEAEGLDDPGIVPETPELDEPESTQGGDSIKVVPESEELVEEDILEDDDKENDRMEDEDYETEEQSGNILSDKTNTLNTRKKGEEEEEKRAKLFRFPQGTIKKLVKLDEDVHMASQDAVFMISK
ncbi:nuclear polyadenylated RNA-binding protein 3 isoform X2 [Eurytemora carolleeae]|nr:nuclear polyadenylated RNA-binding protein 3 isoform X2 [Eurytemora carolleeae]|eukprot:XP_023343466.1 nuclear polyadenylated RNA-binding protein 3-like isoform X2 [Eurytemora affinis]